MRKLLAGVLYMYLQLVFYSSKWTGRLVFENYAVMDALVDTHLERGNRPLILAFWHGRLAMMLKLSPHKHRTYVMISEHRDGQLIADVCRYFGLPAIRGSSNRAKTHAKGAKDRGGSRVLAAAFATLKRGDNIAITPDGPKGPRMRLQRGVTSLASVTGSPVIPVSFSTSFGKTIRSWDRFLLPFPFGRLVILVGQPIFFPHGKAHAQQMGEELERTLNELTHRADSLCGRSPVTPGEPV